MIINNYCTIDQKIQCFIFSIFNFVSYYQQSFGEIKMGKNLVKIRNGQNLVKIRNGQNLVKIRNGPNLVKIRNGQKFSMCWFIIVTEYVPEICC